MVEPQDFAEQQDPLSAQGEQDALEKKDNAVPVEVEMKQTKSALDHALAPALDRKERKLKELSAKREAKELSPFDLDLNFVFQLNEAGLPLTRKDMLHETGKQALLLTRQDLEVLGYLDFIHASGVRVTLEAESLDAEDVFILYPHEMGDEEGQA